MQQNENRFIYFLTVWHSMIALYNFAQFDPRWFIFMGYEHRQRWTTIGSTLFHFDASLNVIHKIHDRFEALFFFVRLFFFTSHSVLSIMIFVHFYKLLDLFLSLFLLVYALACKFSINHIEFIWEVALLHKFVHKKSM